MSDHPTTQGRGMSEFSYYRGESAVAMKQTCGSIASHEIRIVRMSWYCGYMRVLVIDEIGVNDAQVLPASAPRRNSTCLPTVGDYTTNNIGE